MLRRNPHERVPALADPSHGRPRSAPQMFVGPARFAGMAAYRCFPRAGLRRTPAVRTLPACETIRSAPHGT